MSHSIEHKDQSIAAAAATTGAAVGGGEGAVGAGGGATSGSWIGGGPGAIQLPVVLKKLDSTIPPPTEEELEDETSKYCRKVTSGNLFVSSARQEIQEEIRSYVGMSVDCPIRVWPGLKPSAREKAVIDHVLALIQEKFELNGDWLSVAYKKFRNKIRQSAAYVAATANLNKQKAEQMQQTNAAVVGGQVSGGGGSGITRSSTPSTGRSSGVSSGNDDDDEGERGQEHAIDTEKGDTSMSSTIASFGSMRFGALDSSSIHSGTSTRVLAPHSTSAAAAAAAVQFQARVLPQRSLKDTLAEMQQGPDKKKDKDAESK